MNARRYWALPPGERRLLREAALHLLLARAVLAVIPFKRLASWLGVQGEESPAEVPAAQAGTARGVSWAVQAVARRVPWDSRCLAQALAGYRMLRKRGIPSTVYFGVKKDPRSAFNAHAWLRCGSFIVTGEEGCHEYSVLCCFSTAGPETGKGAPR